MSLPLRECGLKSKAKGGKPKDKNVTPFAGVWIEIKQLDHNAISGFGHSPCESVD